MNRYTLEIIRNWKEMPKNSVKINEDKLYAEAEKNACNEFILPKWDEPYINPFNHTAFVSHIFWHNVVNFCYGHPYTENKDGTIKKFKARDISGKIHYGSYAMAACFYRRFAEYPILYKDILPFIKTFSQMKKFFKGFNSMPMLQKRWMMLTESAIVLDVFFQGDPRNILEEGNYKAFGSREKPGIVDILVDKFRLTFGSDSAVIISPLKVFYFYFYKRAQLFILEYNGRAVQSGGALKPIEDINELGPIADYELPRSYNASGIFSYNDYLRDLIQKKEPVFSKSSIEIEIRTATVWAQVKELEMINEIRKKKDLSELNIGHLDYYRWNMGRQLKNINHRICLTTDY